MGQNVTSEYAPYTKTEIQNLANAGQILLVRDGVIINNYGDGRVTAADYGNGIKAAFAAAQPNDTIYCGPLVAEGTQFGLTQDSVKLICQDTILRANGNYSFIFQTTGADCVISGLTADGAARANTSAGGNGMWIDGHRTRVINCRVSRTRGPNISSGTGFYVGNAQDVFVDNLYVYNPQYAGIILNDVQRCELNNIVVHDCIDRALNIQGDEDMDVIKIRNFKGIMTTTVGITNGPGINVNNTSTLGELDIDGMILWAADAISPGVTWNDAQNRTHFKIQNTKKLRMSNAKILHGINSGGGWASSFRLENIINGWDVPEEIIFKDCVFTDGFEFQSNYTPYMLWERCHFGYRACDLNTLIWTARAKEWIVRDSIFNMYDKSYVIGVSANHAPTDYWEFVNNKFLANKEGDVYVLAGGNFRKSFGNGIWHKNELINSGAGGFGLSNSEIETLQMSGNRNGDLMFDDSIIGTGIFKHPNPGASEPWFSGMDVAPAGTKIWNINWESGDTLPQYWQSNGSSWQANI